MRCFKCGNEIREGERICHNCGFSFDPIVNNMTPNQGANINNNNLNSNKNNNIKYIIIGIIILVIVGVAIALLLKKENNDNNNNNNDNLTNEQKGSYKLQYNVPSTLQINDYYDSQVSYMSPIYGKYSCNLTIYDYGDLYDSEQEYFDLEKQAAIFLNKTNISRVESKKINSDTWYTMTVEDEDSKDYYYAIAKDNSFYSIKFSIDDDYNNICKSTLNEFTDSLKFKYSYDGTDKKKNNYKKALKFIDGIEYYIGIQKASDNISSIPKSSATDGKITCILSKGEDKWIDGVNTSGCSSFMKKVISKEKIENPNEGKIVLDKEGFVQEGTKLEYGEITCSYTGSDCDSNN